MCRLRLGAFFVFSFFLAFKASAQEKLIAEGDTWRFFKGKEAPPAEWNTLDFDDSGWEEGPSPFGYGDVTTGTLLTDMQNTYWSVFIRRKFTLSDLASVKALKLSVKYDDGFVAYLNGVELHRKNMPGTVGKPVPFNSPASATVDNFVLETAFSPCAATAALKTGDNVLAIQGQNVTLASSDLAVIPELETIPSVCPTNFTCTLLTDGTVRLNWKKPATTFAYDSIAIMRNGTPVTPAPIKSAASYIDRSPVSGENTYKLIATSCGSECSGADAPTCSVTIQGNTPAFRRGDADANGSVNLADAVVILNHLFRGGTVPPCLDAADSNDDGAENLTDAVFILKGLFQGGPPPPPPGRDTCGPDPTTDDSLATCVYSACQ
jgi:hypothetical protein